MTPHRYHVAAIAVALLCASPALAADAEKKAKETKAKALVAEAKTLEKQEKFLEARTRCLDAQGVIPTGGGEACLVRLQNKLEKETKELLKAAQAEYAGGKYDAALATLVKAETLQPNEGAVHYNRALVLIKLKRPLEAVSSLDLAASLVADGDERRKLQELRAVVASGRPASTLPEPVKKRAEEINEKITDGASDVCASLAADGPLSQEPSVLLNRAKCAEDEGRYSEAAELFEKYLAVAPAAADAGQVKAQSTELAGLVKLDGPAGEGVRSEYALASKAIQRGEYARALQAFLRAEQLLPTYADTQWRLASLHQALGNVADARDRYAKYLALETDADRKAAVEAEVQALEERTTKYDGLVASGREKLQPLLERVFLDGETLDVGYAQRELEEASRPLQEAAGLVPLGSDANAWLAIVYLAGNNYEAARRAYYAVRDKGYPIVHFATVESERPGSKSKALCRIVVREDEIEMAPLATYDKSTKSWKRSGDHAVELLSDFRASPPAGAEVIKLTKAAVKAIETDDNHVRFTLASGKVVLQPHYLASAVPEIGPVARRHANSYTKIYRDFWGFSSAKLGKESMTGGEKFGAIMNIALAAYASYGMASMYGFYSSTQTVYAITSAVQAATSVMQQQVADQRRLLYGNQFRIIPTEFAEPKFRDELLR